MKLIRAAIRQLLNGLLLKGLLAFLLNRCSEIIQMISLYFDDWVICSDAAKNKMRYDVNGYDADININLKNPTAIVIITK